MCRELARQGAERPHGRGLGTRALGEILPDRARQVRGDVREETRVFAPARTWAEKA